MGVHIQVREGGQEDIGGPADEGVGEGQQQFPLVTKVEVDGARGDPRAGGNLFDGRPLIAAFGENRNGGLQNLFAAVLHFRWPGHTTPLNERSFRLYTFRDDCQVRTLPSPACFQRRERGR